MSLAYSYLKVRAGKGARIGFSLNIIAPLIKHQSKQQIIRRSFEVQKGIPRYS